MKAAPVNYMQDPQIQAELDLVQARESAKRMACLRDCGEPPEGEKIEQHSAACPFWDMKGGDNDASSR